MTERMLVRVSAAAKLDLVEIGDYIRADDPVRAETFVQDLLDRCFDLGEAARQYPLIPRYEDRNIRRCVHGRYSIFYRVSESLEIVRILHGARDFEAILFPDGK
jgi:toxin ParE1/3/4